MWFIAAMLRFQSSPKHLMRTGIEAISGVYRERINRNPIICRHHYHLIFCRLPGNIDFAFYIVKA
jgi:hypothetical protein